MAVKSTELATQTPSQSPYQLDIDQTLKAATALLRHVKAETERLQTISSKKSLIATEDGVSDSETTAIWMTLTTKQHIVDKARLRPSKLVVPHSINTSENLTMCLITADPQRAVKDAVADPTFPKLLSSKITRIIGYSKLKARYRSFESRRQLLSEHDIFLADERIITRLVETLGKVFYQGTTKRPVPIKIVHQERKDGKRVKQVRPNSVKKNEHYAAVASPAVVAKEIESTFSAVPVSLKPGTNVAVRVGHSAFTPQQLCDNIKAVATGIIQRHVVKGWRNVKSIHIKSPNSVAIPIWLADDMWIEDGNVIEAEEEQKAIEASKKTRKRKPQAEDGNNESVKKKPKTSDPASSVNEQERALVAARKAKLLQQKQKAKVLPNSVTL